MPKIYYQVKKILCPMGMEIQKIHVCLNDCILYKHDYEEMHKCPTRRVSQCKVKDDDECSSDENTKKGPPSRSIMVSFEHSKVQAFVC